MAKAFSQLGVNYEQSPLTQKGSANNSIRSGHRVRDADVLRAADATEVSLFKELCAPNWKLVLFDGGKTASWLAPLKLDALPTMAQYFVVAGHGVRHDAADVYHDLDRVAHQIYGITEPTALLIRPDNYIAAVVPGNDLAGLQRYIAAWYLTSKLAD